MTSAPIFMLLSLYLVSKRLVLAKIMKDCFICRYSTSNDIAILVNLYINVFQFIIKNSWSSWFTLIMHVTLLQTELKSRK